MWVDIGRAASSARVMAASAVAGFVVAFTAASAAAMNSRDTAAGAIMPSAVTMAILPPVVDTRPRDAESNRMLWPTHGWITATPEDEGIDSAILANAMKTIRARHLPVHSLLVERYGRIVLDAYFNPFEDNQLHGVASVTKSVLSTLIGIAIGERRMSGVETPVLAEVPDPVAESHPLKRRLTLAHMLSMTSGLDCSSEGGRNYLQQMESTAHWVTYAIERPEVTVPGTSFNYCAGNMHIASAMLTRSTGLSAADFARVELFTPLGIDRFSWDTDADGISHGFSDLHLQPRDMAKLGCLWLHRGVWEGRQIVPAEYIDAARTPQINVRRDIAYGYGLWLYPNRGHAGGPADFEANGSGGQRIAVIPSQDMVEVITGDGLNANDVASLLAASVKSDSALPPNHAANERLALQIASAAAKTSTFYALQPEPKSTHRLAKLAVRVASFEKH